uniref:MATH domain-containing protein n=1 Tax=Ditylenchus dipsaci TaxID=166011 RepID=A0A915CVW6_9BILA
MSNSWDRPVPSSLTGTVSKQATKVKIVSCKLEWRIDQFKKLMKFCKNGENVVSEQFLSVCVPILVWELHVYPSGKREKDKGSVSFFLRQVASQELPCPITADFKYIALDDRGLRVSICHDIKDFSDLQGRGNSRFRGHIDINDFPSEARCWNLFTLERLVLRLWHIRLKKLKEECARFIAVHYNSVIRMPEWNEFKLSCSALVNELLESALDDAV